MNTIRKTWTGHAESILAIDINSNGLLSSVSEDGRCLLWALDGKILSDTLVDCDVRSTAVRSQDCPLNSVKFVPNDPDKFFISSGNEVLGYDVRKPSFPFTKYEFNKDEINQISINDKGEYLAACDDEGEIKVIDLKQERLFKTLSRRHTNICSSVQFRAQRPWQILSAGLDCNIIHWDFSTGKARQTFNMNDHLKTKNDTQLFMNPPFAHCLSTSEDGWRCAVGLGNGDIGLFNFQGKTFQCPKTFKAHDTEVSQVYYFDGKCSSRACLISGGNDGKINMWIEAQAGEDGGLCHQIVHGSKINWITCSSFSKDLIIVADQSPNVNIYEIH